MNTIVSVIMPIYNSGLFLNRAIDSILRQTYINLEIILVDDGSTDKSLSICQSYSKADYRVKVVTQKNKGVSAARNRGLKEATGTFLFFIDGDDYLEDTMIEKMIREMDSGIDMVVCGVDIHYDQSDKKNAEMGISKKQEIITVKELACSYWDYYEKGVINSPWNKIFRKKIIDENHLEFPTGIKIGEDAQFNLSYFLKSRKIKIINDRLYHYFIYQGQSSQKYNNQYYEMMLTNFEKIWDFISINNGFDNKETLLEYYYQIYRHALYSIRLFYRNKANRTAEKKEYIYKIANRHESDYFLKVKPKRIEDFFVLTFLVKKRILSLYFYIKITENARKIVNRIKAK